MPSVVRDMIFFASVWSRDFLTIFWKSVIDIVYLAARQCTVLMSTFGPEKTDGLKDE